MVTRSSWYHRQCLRCVRCAHPLDQTNFNDGPDGGVYCNACYRTLDPKCFNLTAKSMTETATIRADRGEKDACPR